VRPRKVSLDGGTNCPIGSGNFWGGYGVSRFSVHVKRLGSKGWNAREVEERIGKGWKQRAAREKETEHVREEVMEGK